MLAFVLAWLYAACSVLNRTLKEVHVSVIMFFHACFGITFSLTLLFANVWISGTELQIYTKRQYGIMVLASLCDYVAVNCQTLAFQKAPSSFVSLVGYVAVLYAFLSDVCVFHETIYLTEILAALTILSVTIYVAF